MDIPEQPSAEMQQTSTSPPENAQEAGTTNNNPSAWNPSSSHWEERQLTPWCLSTLTERFTAAKLSLLEGSAELMFFNVSVKGEASLSLRKNRKMLFFDLSAEADWTATARDKDGRFLADSRGHMTLKEFSSDDDDCRITFSGDGKVPPQHRIDNAAKKEGPLQVTELLKQFVQEMRSKA
ncbi:uncharacterized protein LOC34619950 [Cyclospora cayetanensis]|uniref:Uncharacterized protein LOC34619950 n=1 Tax=Cyclospora cayetanensis TaxID=88456 RepID=A0A6P6RT18_9EIME|nr:uncharacterized protein LOC34619950 [Cyclospora cayetanensis]